jgi:hypothetical protein
MANSEGPPLNPKATNAVCEHPGRRLDSWKEIASWFNRSEKTVRRWEEREGLPVHRLLHHKRGTVNACIGELEAGRQSTGERYGASPACRDAGIGGGDSGGPKEEGAPSSFHC